MRRLPLHPASGTGVATSLKTCIRFALYGCTNRPFYHIVVIEEHKHLRRPPIEQLGSYDPEPNKCNEKLVSLNLERIQYWLGTGAKTSKPVAELLGLAGFFPIHPKTYIKAWRRRRWNAYQEARKKIAEEKPSEQEEEATA